MHFLLLVVCRGADGEGNVANFVETEQSLLLDGTKGGPLFGNGIYSFVQVIGLAEC